MGFFQPLHRRPWAEDRFGLVVSRGYVQLVRHSGRPSPSAGRGVAPFKPTPGEDELIGQELESEELEAEEAAALGRGDRGQTSRSRNNMRRLFGSLPWEMLGTRPAMISLTYPGEWRKWVPDGRVMEAHRRAFERRWVRRWKEPLVGVWVKEFQESGRPHMHLYVGLPTAMSAEDYAGLRQRTLIRRSLERQLGQYEGRKALPAISQQFGGEFAMWIRTAWAEIVGTQGKHQRHHARGVDVAVMFWTDDAEAAADRTRVAEYLAGEASKWRQKRPPKDFSGVGKYFGRWGGHVGFNPIREEVEIDRLVAAEMERRLARWVGWKIYVRSYGRSRTLHPQTRILLRHWGDGITAFGLGPEQAARLLRWSEAAAERKRAKAEVSSQEEAAGRGTGHLAEPAGPGPRGGEPPQAA
ncbi:MAG TPA: hypothetical protein VFP54_02900 [Acidimicrobiales bacterium]|nr:hypothetical protein [Acidimicrobiales bacterium]